MWQIVRRGTIYVDGTSTDFDVVRKSDGVVMFKGSANREQTAWHLQDAFTGMIVRVMTWPQVVGMGEVK